MGATDVPSLLILNKKDRLSEKDINDLKAEFPEAIQISTRNKDDLKMLRDKIMSYFESSMIDEDLFIPYTVQGVIGDIRAKMRVLGESYNENGVTLKVRASEDLITQIKKKLNVKNN